MKIRTGAGNFHQFYSSRVLPRIVLLGTVLNLTCGPASAAGQKPMTSIHVTADVYSGRKNPEWDLVGEQVTDFRARLTGLRADPAKVNERPDQLGYRGLILDMTSDGSTQRFVIASGTVIVEPTSSGARRVLLDPGRTLEKWVLRTGKNALGPDLLASLLADK